MKTIAIVLATIILVVFRNEERGDLKITLSNIKKAGKIYAAVYKEGDDFPSDKTILSRSSGDAAKGKCELTIGAIPFGAYAIAVYQDVNGNGKLDTGMFGIPQEPFAFSNNFRPKFGGPSFDKCKFDFKEDNQTLTMEMINSLFGGD
jgi:uncharacterized protein (DUF2141 family)